MIYFILIFRPVSALFDIEVNKSNTNKLIEVLNRELVEVHGHFQVVLIVSTHTNQMNEAIINEILDLFQPFKSFGMFRYVYYKLNKLFLD